MPKVAASAGAGARGGGMRIVAAGSLSESRLAMAKLSQCGPAHGQTVCPAAGQSGQAEHRGGTPFRVSARGAGRFPVRPATVKRSKYRPANGQLCLAGSGQTGYRGGMTAGEREGGGRGGGCCAGGGPVAGFAPGGPLWGDVWDRTPPRRPPASGAGAAVVGSAGCSYHARSSVLLLCMFYHHSTVRNTVLSIFSAKIGVRH